jgi:hypothetical protein
VWRMYRSVVLCDIMSRIREVIEVRLLDGYVTMSSFAYLSC